jgi:hypothetical protein
MRAGFEALAQQTPELSLHGLSLPSIDAALAMRTRALVLVQSHHPPTVARAPQLEYFVRSRVLLNLHLDSLRCASYDALDFGEAAMRLV